MPITQWPVYADHRLAGKRRSWPTPPAGSGGRFMPIFGWPVYADR
jgi:hypothetical protein